MANVNKAYQVIINFMLHVVLYRYKETETVLERAYVSLGPVPT
jgi:hypothetical protein